MTHTASGIHTPPPWYVQAAPNGHVYIRDRTDDSIVATMSDANALATGDAITNARRIVACLHALEGIGTLSIEFDGIGGVKRTLAENLSVMLKLRNSLRAVQDDLNTSIGEGCDAQSLDVSPDAQQQMRDALAFSEARMPQRQDGAHEKAPRH